MQNKYFPTGPLLKQTYFFYILMNLMERDIRVVLHKWEPSDAIQNAIGAAGAVLVLLDSADPGMVENRQLVADGLQQILRSNLDAISNALSQ